MFLLKWTDSTRDWVPRGDIDEEMVREFEASYDGVYEGVDILGVRGKGAKKQYKLHWKDRPHKEEGWVAERLISKRLLREHEEQSGKAKDLLTGS